MYFYDKFQYGRNDEEIKMISLNKIHIVKILFLLLSIYSVQAYALEVALSFDDAPLGSGPILTGKERANKLTQALKDNNVQEVVFFCSNLKNFSDEDQARIRHYAESGHIIANHSTSHLDLQNPTVSAKEFIADIIDADKKLNVFPNYKRWFRYPYLRQSSSIISKDNNRAVEEFLEKEKYKHGYITIETYDWYLNKLVKQDIEKGIQPSLDKLRQVYLTMIWDGILFYDNLAKEVLGRSPKHVTLLHENDMSALFIGDLIAHVRNHGGKIIPISEAYTDPIADRALDAIPYSQRRIRAIARQKKYDGKLISQYEDDTNIDKLYRTMIPMPGK